MAYSAVAGSASPRRFQLARPRRGIAVGAIAVLTGLLAWWIATAGAVTVFRIVYFNKTGIEDYKLFPSRALVATSNAAPLPAAATDLEGLPEELSDRLEHLLPANDTVAFLVVHNGKLVLERYYGGWTKESLSQSFSMGKSFLSMLIGAAIEDGYIGSVSDPVTDYVPELAEGGFSDVTIEDLLQMRSGSNYVENENPFGIHARFTYTPDIEGEILALRVEADDHPWSYKSGDTAILTLALDRALGAETVSDYTQRRLWSPLGMEADGLWTVDHPTGVEKTWCCMAATARDYAKLGLLYLKHGRVGGRQIIPSEWVERSAGEGFSTKSVLQGHHTVMGVWSFNYHWWLVSPEQRDYMASGHGGQFLYINPSSNTVIVRLGRSQGDLKQAQWVDLLQDVAAGARERSL